MELHNRAQGAATTRLPSATVKAPKRYLLKALRWVVTTPWLLLLIGMLILSASFLVSLQTGAWHWFQRSGALLVSIGAMLSTQGAFKTLLGRIIGDGPQGRNLPSIDAADRTSRELWTCLCGFWIVGIGTLVWAYGDLIECLIHANTSCVG